MNKKDFEFVQSESKIRDVKLQTKPTTFFKDAIKRFVKNKVSVVAFSFIGFLVALSIIVPLVNTSNIDQPNTAARFLPPRWALLEDVGIFDGTITYNNIILDASDSNNLVPVGFNTEAIKGGNQGIVISDGYINNASEFANGGFVKIQPSSTSSGGIQSSQVFLAKNSEFIVQINTPIELNEAEQSPIRYRIIADVKYFFDQDLRYEIELIPFSKNYGIVEIDNIVQTLITRAPAGFSLSSIGAFNVIFRIEVEQNLEVQSSALLVKSFTLTDKNNASNQVASIGFVDGNSLILRDLADVRINTWPVYNGAQKNVFQAAVKYGSFKYDPYVNVYGEKEFLIGESELQIWIDSGFISFSTPTKFPNLSSAERLASFVRLTDESPVISITEEKVIVGPDFSVYEYVARVSMYRFYGHDSIPYFLFGTNHNGADYFKVVFSGLQTSLLLGLAGMLINVSFGMIWGSISGYFGGNVDLGMERVTEILGGVPWIVIITLAILHLGNNFTTFLIALTLTGWIGTSSLTRSQFYRYKRREYVLASRTLGASDWRLIFRHILPNSIGPIVTSSVLLIPGIIFSEATISYLGIGLQGLPSLGVALSQAQEYLETSPYLIGWGSLIISILMISFNLFGNGLRDAFNPSLKGVD
jgi:ABC-type dipeptide/oligopeptide/nickel transport system permease subunit